MQISAGLQKRFIYPFFTLLIATQVLIACTFQAGKSLAVETESVALLDEMYRFVREQEALILNQGSPLTPKEKAIARKLEIKNYDQIRVYSSRSLPEFPQSLKSWAKKHRINARSTAALTFGYGIYIRKGFRSNKLLLAHELVHVKQIEREGLKPLLKRYLIELDRDGYKNSSIEKEAYRKAREIISK